MTKEEITRKIDRILSNNNGTYGFDYFDASQELTNMFIKMSDERCKEQRISCHEEYFNLTGLHNYDSLIEDSILKAPIPEIL